MNRDLTPTGIWLDGVLRSIPAAVMSILRRVNPNRRTWPDGWIGPLTWGYNKNTGLHWCFIFRRHIITAYQSPKGSWHFAHNTEDAS